MMAEILRPNVLTPNPNSGSLGDRLWESTLPQNPSTPKSWSSASQTNEPYSIPPWQNSPFSPLKYIPTIRIPANEPTPNQRIEPEKEPDQLQRKLSIGTSNDSLEQEADRVAGQVMRMGEAEVRTSPAPPSVQRLCPECEEELRKKPAEGSPNTDVAPSIVHEVLRSSGQPLDAETRAFFEPRFRQDFSDIRVHNDAQAAESASAVNALAYTVGTHVVFNNAQYQPNSSNGRNLLAHELTHAIQQSGNNAYSTNSLVVGESDDRFESVANSVSDSIEGVFTIGNSIAVEKTPNASGTIQRVAGVDDAAEAVTLGTALAWCVSGALTTVALDEAVQLARWGWNGGKFKQNMCDTLFSALFGCVFGIAGGAFEKMFLSEGVAITGWKIASWIIKKLKVLGFNMLAGKLGLTLAKYGCAEVQKNSVATLEDDGNSNQDVTNQGQDNTTSSDISSVVA